MARVFGIGRSVVSRNRRSVPWAATSVPEVRRRWCYALAGEVTRHQQVLDHPQDTGTAQSGRTKRMLATAQAALTQMRDEIRAIRTAEMYWVARDMVDVAVEASATLPEWTPGLALPADNGLLCWAKPAGRIPWTSQSEIEVSWDAVSWWSRPDGLLQIQPLSRLSTHAELVEPFGHPPLWAAATTLLLDPTVARTDEVTGSLNASFMVSIVGSAWLLMGLPVITATRTIAFDDREPAPDDTAEPEDSKTATSPSDRDGISGRRPMVSIIELHRLTVNGAASPQHRSGRHYRRQWWVEGHWRQQACGPGRSQRKPTWIAPYIKGPTGAPLTGDRVTVWRR